MEITEARGESASESPGTKPGDTVALFLVSVLGLFLELLLIRWIGTEVRIFAYLQNTILVVCFLGLGMGCLTSDRTARHRDLLLPLFALVLLMAIPYTRGLLQSISARLGSLPDMVIWFQAVRQDTWQTISSVGLGLLLTLLMLVLIWETFVPVGRWTARLIGEHPRALTAYSWNVAGSLLGIWLFVGMSVLYLGPVFWFAMVLGLVLLLQTRKRAWRVLDTVLILSILALAWFCGRDPGALTTLWSPYQKLSVYSCPPDQPTKADYVVQVNNVSYQYVTDISERRMSALQVPVSWRGLDQYSIPILLHPSPKRMLIVGAGAGNDASAGVRRGVPSITAVEIDPAIVEVGRRYHPEKPYDAPSVHVVVEDARAFFSTCEERFDVITFGLLDSHTTTMMTNARLDHYVYTLESLRAAKRLLAPHGVMVIMFWCQRPFIADRIATEMKEVFGAEPLIFRISVNLLGAGATFFVAGDLEGAQRQIQGNENLARLVDRAKKEVGFTPTYTTRPGTDDWPYLYLDSPRIPVLYYLLAGMMLLLLVYGMLRVRRTDILRRWDRARWHFFFLGAGFLLLEVQNISKAAVVLGNTWWVNAVVISGILAMILAANWIAIRAPRLPVATVGLCLCASCIGLYFVDLARLASLPFGWRALSVAGITSVPMVFSGVLFARSFSGVGNRGAALGANLLGALVGGLLQSVTFVTGVQALLLIVAGLYAVAVALCFGPPRGPVTSTP